VLQPCDVGVFGPLARAWKSRVTRASQDNIAITKDSLLVHYHDARSLALKPSTIQSAFKKTGIYPLDRNIIPISAFEPAKNTTTQAAQPLPARLPSLLTPTPDPSPAVSVATIDTLPPVLDSVDRNSIDPADGQPPDAEPNAAGLEPCQPTQRYHIEVPPPLPYNASRRALRDENQMLRAIIVEVGRVLERDYAQMKLMDIENESLRKKAFAKEKRKRKLTSGQARHMTSNEMIELLARQTWESAMADVFKEASEQFKARRKAIDDHHKALAAEKKLADRKRKAAEQRARKAEAEAEKTRLQAERTAVRGRGRGRQTAQPRGDGRGRGRGRGQGRIDMLAPDIDSDDSGLQISDSSSGSTDEEDVQNDDTPPARRPTRECRARAPRFLPSDTEEDIPPQVIRPRPRPRPIHAGQPPVEQQTTPPSDVGIPPPQEMATSPPQLDHHRLPPGEKALSIGTTNEVPDDLDDTITRHESERPIANAGGSNAADPTDGDVVQSENDMAGPSMTFLGVKPSGGLMGGESVDIHGSQVRRSRRLAMKIN
jgi:hypothetical protein